MDGCDGCDGWMDGWVASKWSASFAVDGYLVLGGLDAIKSRRCIEFAHFPLFLQMRTTDGAAEFHSNLVPAC